ncbi:MAG: hypothetical protein ABR969_06000 [Sedimentisphaerales bacterium]|jgi:hypothetical protein
MEIDAEQKTKVIRNTKANILAIASVTIDFLWWMIVPIIWGNKRVLEKIEKTYFYLIYTGRCFWITAFLCGVISLISARRIKGSQWSKPIAIIGCILAIYSYFGVPHLLSEVLEGRAEDCKMNLNTLSTSIKAYCEKHNGEFPAPAKWCDLLLSKPPQKSDDKYGIYWKLSEKSFKCPTATARRCGYAFNKNLTGKHISEVDPNVVVVFEANSVGWNQNGDSKMMCPDMHMTFLGENGSNVLFPNQYDVRFVPQSEVKNLRWEP